jgi:uncharacterized protein (TIGR02117 family)
VKRVLFWLASPLLLLLVLLVAGAILYFSGVLVGGWWPVNRAWQPAVAEPRITIFLRTNGVHTDFVFPLDDMLGNQVIAWRAAFPGRDFGTPKKPPKYELPLALDAKLDPSANPLASHIAIGWGDRGFYLDTPEWADLNARTALRALSGTGRSAMHAEYLSGTRDDASFKRIVVSQAEYRKLVDYIEREFARAPATGARRVIPRAGYTVHDAFYEANTPFNLFLTCNEWVRRGLAQAGIRTAAWSPFHQPIYRQLP